MKTRTFRRTSRAGFTLVEVLVVISIIAVLAALTTGAVMRVIITGPRTLTRTEIGQLEQALRNAATELHNVGYIPSQFVLREDAYNPNNSAHRASIAYLEKAFGKRIFKGTNGSGWLMLNVDWNGVNGVESYERVLQGHECLVFFLGGIPNGTSCTGFSKNPQDPSDKGTNFSRWPPFYNFKSNRLKASGANGFLMYIDGYNLPSNAKPYLYYSSYKASNGYQTGDCSTVAGSFTPYKDPSGRFLNPDGFQIISAGYDGNYGSGGSWPASGATGADADNQANFFSGLLGSPH